MDNLCHTLVGAALGQAGLKRHSRFATATLMIAANLPDVDVLVFATDTPSVAFRRGWTHGPIAQLVLPVALTAAVIAVSRLFPSRARADDTPVRAGALLLLSWVAVLSHLALDLLNAYGLRFLAPLDWTWFYGDVLFIIDPWLWVILGGGVWLARRVGSTTPARHALVAAGIYILAMTINARLARNIVLEEWRVGRGGAPVSLMVGPVPVTPFRRQIIVDAGINYETGAFEWIGRRVAFDPSVIPKNDTDPRVDAARAAPNIRGFLVWSRFPFWRFEAVPGGTRVTVSDVRFAGQTPARFEASTIVPENQHTSE
jgi:inner membrane protein